MIWLKNAFNEYVGERFVWGRSRQEATSVRLEGSLAGNSDGKGKLKCIERVTPRSCRNMKREGKGGGRKRRRWKRQEMDPYRKAPSLLDIIKNYSKIRQGLSGALQEQYEQNLVFGDEKRGKRWAHSIGPLCSARNIVVWNVVRTISQCGEPFSSPSFLRNAISFSCQFIEVPRETAVC